MQNTSIRSYPRFQWRAFTSVLVGLAFVLLALSGFMLFLSPPGRIANWTDWTLLSLRKSEWAAIHIWFGLIFLIMSILHIVFNWRVLVGYFKDRLTRKLGTRREWISASAITVVIAGGTLYGAVPFSSLIAWNEAFKASWEEPASIAPIPHAELLTLAELAQKAGVPVEAAIARLASKGIQGVEPTHVVKDIAEKAQISPQKLHEIIRTGAGKGGEAGGGLGWKTLTDFCATEGMSVDAAIALLASNGIKATPEQTLREIAVANGMKKPFELVNILKPGTH